MAAFNPVNIFSYDVYAGNHNFSGAAGVTYKVALSNTAPNNTMTKFVNITEIAAGAGYVAGGLATTVSMVTAGASTTLFATDVTFTAAGGTMATFRYAVLYKFAPGASNSVRPLCGWWDYGITYTLLSADHFTVDFNGTSGFLQVN